MFFYILSVEMQYFIQSYTRVQSWNGVKCFKKFQDYHTLLFHSFDIPSPYESRRVFFKQHACIFLHRFIFLYHTIT